MNSHEEIQRAQSRISTQAFIDYLGHIPEEDEYHLCTALPLNDGTIDFYLKYSGTTIGIVKSVYVDGAVGIKFFPIEILN